MSGRQGIHVPHLGKYAEVVLGEGRNASPCLPLQKWSHWNDEVLEVGPKRLQHFLEVEETCVPVLVSGHFSVFTINSCWMKHSMRALLSDLIPGSQKRKLNISSASQVSSVVLDGGREREVRRHHS